MSWNEIREWAALIAAGVLLVALSLVAGAFVLVAMTAMLLVAASPFIAIIFAIAAAIRWVMG